MEKKTKKSIVIGISVIALVTLTLLGLTYAYYRTRIIGNDKETSISVTNKKLELVYEDGNGTLTPYGTLSPSNDYVQFSDANGNAVGSKIFTVTNTGDDTVNYKVYLVNVVNSLERKEDLVYTLTCKSFINYGTANQTESGSCIGADGEVTFPDAIESVTEAIATNDIEAGITQEYELKLKYKYLEEDQSVDMGKTISAKINIYDETVKFFANEILLNAKSGEAGRSVYTLPENLDPQPAIDVNKADEKVLSYEEDDYGTSYYFRGAVEDNYVNFADMCWRIVRIEGDGSVKLILEDQDNLCKESDGNWNIPLETGGTENVGNFGYSRYKENSKGVSTYVPIVDYLEANTENEKSMAVAFRNFQKTFTSDELSKLKSGNWCYNTVAYKTFGEAPVDYDTFLTWLSLDYDSVARLGYYYKTSLKCPTTPLNVWQDNTPMYVGAITGDEATLAGAHLDYENENLYLINNYQKNNNLIFWTFSPLLRDISGDHMFVVNSLGLLWDDDGNVSKTLSFRPTISIKSSIEIVEGNGLKTNPYVIAS